MEGERVGRNPLDGTHLALVADRTGVQIDPGEERDHARMQSDRNGDHERVQEFRKLIALAPYPELAVMMQDLSYAPAVYQPSKFWISFVRRNLKQLRRSGLRRFKRKVNQNYFNFVGDQIEEQVSQLLGHLDTDAARGAAREVRPLASILNKPSKWSYSQWRRYLEFLHLLRRFTAQRDRFGLLDSLEEPALGRPIAARYDGLRYSQDLCNSVLEINAAMEGLGWDPDAELSVAELGGGYGRIAYALLRAAPGASVTLIDIPPALYIAQWYLCSLFPDRRIFRYRTFERYEDIHHEMAESSIRFLAPPQVELLPERCFDLFINVSSLHEMTFEQIALWYRHIHRLCSGYFYTKQWMEHQNEHDKIVVKRKDYPRNPEWEQLFDRTCALHPRFFEALYRCHP